MDFKWHDRFQINIRQTTEEPIYRNIVGGASVKQVGIRIFRWLFCSITRLKCMFKNRVIE